MKQVLAIIFLLCASAFGADRERYVDTGSSGGNGTTNAISGANAAYASLNACLVAELAADGTLTDEGYLNIHCNRTNGGGKDTTAATVSNTWVQDATHKIRIHADDFPTTGIYDDTKYVLSVTNDECLYISDYCDATHMQFEIVETGTGVATGIWFALIAGYTINIDGCIFKGTCSGTGGVWAIYANDADVTANVYNSIFTGIKSGTDSDFFAISAANCTAINVYNCTLYDCGKCISRAAGTVTVANCAVESSIATTNEFIGTITVTNCLSGSGTGTNPQTPKSGSWANEFTNTTGLNFALKSGGNAIGNGVDNPGSGLYSDDIIGTTRTSTWDIGAFEYQAPALNLPALIMTMNQGD